ncbi:MAG: acetylxylan esterase [Armatimonadetes bacterium]|nr:acetylxylan esterase [Armatimonadota bacterium]
MHSENLFPHLWRHVCALEEQRRAAWAAMRTADDVLARARWVRETVGRMVGPFPARCDLNPRVTKTFDRADYTAESLIFDSRPGFPVTATLYLPKHGERPLPAVLSPCGHSANGRMYEVYQRAHVGLCKAGFAVLSYDPISQGERVQYLDADGKPILDNCCHEHCMAGNQLNLTGSSMANIRVWDGIRAFDYLETRPEIDTTRVAVAGNSGGGTLSTHLLCLEGRLAAGAPNCYITTLVHRIATRMAADSEQQFVPMLRQGIDHADLLLAAAPSAILVCARSQDFFPLEGARQTVAELKQAYALLGCPENVELCVDEGDHHWSKALREGGVRWFRRFLCGSEERYEEPEFPVEEDATLWATGSGNVLTAGLGALEVHEIVKRDAAPQLACRAKSDPAAAVRRELPRLLGIDPAAARRPWPMPEYMRVPEAPPPGPAGVRTQWVEFPSDFDVRLTGLLFTPEKPSGRAVLMAPDEEGIAPLLARNGRAYQAALAGDTVLAVDPRGGGRDVGASPARAAVSGFLDDRQTYPGDARLRCLECGAMAA